MKDHHPDNEKEKTSENPQYFWGLWGRDFIKRPGRKIYEPIPDRPKDDRQHDSPNPFPVRIRRDFLDLAMVLSGWVISVLTLGIIGVYTYYAGGQWIEMRRAANASAQASCTATQALRDSEYSSIQTLYQMQAQTDAQQTAANAALESSNEIKVSNSQSVKAFSE
jgi:hypothetical protein